MFREMVAQLETLIICCSHSLIYYEFNCDIHVHFVYFYDKAKKENVNDIILRIVDPEK